MTKTMTYRPEIDGLRALAVLAVFFYHLDIPLFKGGFVGVDIFFVISGFLITKIITTHMAQGNFSFADFYVRRIKRIFPALFAMLVLTTVAAILFLVPIEYRDFMHALRYAALQASNIMFVDQVSYFQNAEAENPLLHTWSLGVEEQFYLVWPLLFWLLYKLKRLNWVPIILGLLAVASLGFSEYLLGANQNYAFYLLPARAWELALGGVVALAKPALFKKPWAFEILASAGVGFMLVAIVGFDNINFPGVKALLPCVGAALFLYTTTHKPQATMAAKFLALRPVVFVGLISYSLYLWHWPMIAFYKDYTLKSLTPTIQLIIFITSFGMAILSWGLVERPFRLYQPKQYIKVFSVALFAVLAVVLFSNGLKEGYKQSWRYIGEFDKKIFNPEFQADVCQAQRQYHPKHWCVDNVKGKNYEVLFVGDSHTGHYTQAIQAWAKQKHYNIRYITRAACSVWFVDQRNTATFDGKISKECANDQKEFIEALQHKHLRYVVMALRLDAYIEPNPMSRQFINWRYEPIDNLDESRAIFRKTVIESWAQIKQMTHQQAQLVFLGQVPVSRDSATQCHLKNKLLGSKLVPDNYCVGLDTIYSQSRLVYGQKLMKELSKKYHVAYFDPVNYIKKFEDDQGNLIYRDGNHLNNYGANLLVKPFVSFMQEHSYE